MKNLLTLLLLVISLLASGQSDSQSLEVEIQYWKSIAESNDTVAYREYLQRYGEDGLYKDEALTRIALLKTSGKQTKSNMVECVFYYKTKRDPDAIYYPDAVYYLQFGVNPGELSGIHQTGVSDLRKKLARSPDYYERNIIITTDYKYNQSKSTSARDVYSKRDTRQNKAYSGRYWEEEKEFHGYRYMAISKDRSSIITWFEDDDNYDGIIKEKEEYRRVPKEDFLPKSVNYDFLNE